MATTMSRSYPETNDYPTSDGRPMAETDTHYRSIHRARATLEAFFAGDPMTYVSGNLLVFYDQGDRLRHVAPDIFVVQGAPKRERLNYLIWEEKKSLDLTIEFTSKSTHDEDVDDKFWLYEKKLKVKEYFLFDPLGDYLVPPLKGYRLRQGKYAAVRPVNGRLSSQVLGLHLEQDGSDLRFYNPVTKQWLPTPDERIAQAEAENRRLRRELEDLRRRTGKR